MPHVYVDADACPVKPEIYRVAERLGLAVTLIANAGMTVPKRDWIELEVVSAGFDAADDRIVERVRPNDLVVTADVPLAARCVAKNARAIAPNGRVWDEKDMGQALATRDLLTELRSAGAVTRGPAPLGPRDRSRFLQALDAEARAALRAEGKNPG